MSTDPQKIANITQTIAGRTIVPFTGGLFAIYAFFWPEGFGHWFGTIIHEIRIAAGL